MRLSSSLEKSYLSYNFAYKVFDIMPVICFCELNAFLVVMAAKYNEAFDPATYAWRVRIMGGKELSKLHVETIMDPIHPQFLSRLAQNSPSCTLEFSLTHSGPLLREPVTDGQVSGPLVSSVSPGTRPYRIRDLRSDVCEPVALPHSPSRVSSPTSSESSRFLFQDRQEI